MSAIAGILHFGGAPVVPGLIEKLANTMSARGPDEQHCWSAGSVALGHCMLRTTPESFEEHQPLVSRDRKLVLVWDGRLDNRGELRRDLIAGGAILRDNSDAELTLQSYAVWGEECPRRLLGDFAFVVWDAARNHLFCARDHMGARPFFYSRNDRFFAFASEEEALTQLPGVSGRPNEELIAHILLPTFGSFDSSRSWLEDVWVLSSAKCMTVSVNGKAEVSTYWQLAPGEEQTYASDEACREAFLDVFGEAVRCRLRSSGHVAAMMSGGLDSASIGAMAKRLLPEMPGKELHSYSAISDYPETCVESQCIQKSTSHLGDKAHFVSVPSFAGMVNVEDLIDVGWSRAHPVDNSIVLPAMMCLAASRNGHRVMLHGMAGDLTMYLPVQYIAYLMLAGKWRQAWKECRDASRNFTYRRGTSPALILLLNVWTAYVPSALKLRVYRLRERGAGGPLARSLINRGFAERLKLVESMRDRERKAARSSTDLQPTHIRALWAPPGIPGGLEGYDRVAGRYGVELRDPWADKRVVEFFLRLPLKYKVREGWTKYLVRSGFAPNVTPEIRWRTGKEHLGWHFICRLMDETNGLVSQTLEEGMDALGKYADVNAVRTRLAQYRTAKGDDERKDLYDIMTLVLWNQRILR